MREVTVREYDLNIFWEEFYDKYLGTWWDDKLTIDVYKYEAGDDWADKKEVGLTFKLTREESLALIEHFPEDEYGTDWFVFLPEVIHHLPERVVNIFGRELPELEPVDVKEEVVMNEVIDDVVVERGMSHTSSLVLSVMDESFVPSDKTIQLSFATHLRGGGIVSTCSVELTDEEAVELIDKIEEVMAANKRTMNERKVLADFYKEVTGD